MPLRHPGRWAAAAVLLVLAAMLAHNMLTNPRWQWGVIRSNLFSPPIVSGAENTIKITIFAMAIGVILGILLAVMRLSPNQVLSSAAWLFIWFFRGTPVYLQLTFWYAISSLFPTFSLGVPFGPEFVHLSANTIITPLVAGLLGLGLNEGAYYAEIVRAGILSVDHGQFEAAQSLGMRRATLMRKIVLPQAMRVIVPPTGNELNNMLKTTSLLVVVTYPELMYQTTNDAARTFEAIPFYVGACMWYLFMTTLLTIGQFYVERYYARGSSYALPPTPIQRMRRNLTPLRRIPFSASGTGGS